MLEFALFLILGLVGITNSPSPDSTPDVPSCEQCDPGVIIGN